VVRTLDVLGRLMTVQGLERRALDYFTRAVTAARRNPGDLRVGVSALSALASVHLQSGELGRAEALLTELETLLAGSPGVAPFAGDAPRMTRAMLLMEQRRLPEALAITTRMLAERRERSDAPRPSLAIVLLNHAAVLQDLGRFEDALAAVEESLRLSEAEVAGDHLYLIDSRIAHADALEYLGRAEQALAVCRSARELLVANRVPPGSYFFSELDAVEGAVLARQGKWAEAEPLLRRAQAELTERLGPNARATREANRRLREGQRLAPKQG
jgi:tetratricopeptide (TPR) repeat protein